MNKQEILNIFEYVSAVDTDCARDLTYSISLLHTCIEKSLDVVKRQINAATNANRFDDVITYSDCYFEKVTKDIRTLLCR